MVSLLILYFSQVLITADLDFITTAFLYLPLAPSSWNLESYVDDSKLFLSFPVIELDAAIEKLE